MSRVEEIQEVLQQYLSGEHVAVSIASREEWADMHAALSGQGHAPYGWTAPVMVVPICPELIEAQTRQLSDEELSNYLDVMKWMIQVHLALWFQERDPLVRAGLAEDQLAESSPEALSVWSSVQLAALDATG